MTQEQRWLLNVVLGFVAMQHPQNRHAKGLALDLIRVFKLDAGPLVRAALRRR